ncbi:uncharacterized protein I303_101805 [Kwoniella dejecticola CBS 10117]|uniref:Phytocyanin domain-containing protein n=1 Tax=Kwoniella dejecticola CBS 10117 TaxID=1296121 RepID=A0AAJ8KKS7_9TREE
MFGLTSSSTLLTCALMLSSALGATHTVLVASNGTKTYSPTEVKAELGDIVEFQFMAGNHTASQSTFADPYTNAGFKSGFIPGNASSPTSFSILVNETKPIWVYCAQATHCKDGMVMAINAPSEGNTFAAFQANAMGGGNATVSGNSTGSASTSSSPSASSSSSSPSSDSGSGTGSEAGNAGTSADPVASASASVSASASAAGGNNSSTNGTATGADSAAYPEISIAGVPALALLLPIGLLYTLL